MFSKFKEKLSAWTKKITESSKEKSEEKIKPEKLPGKKEIQTKEIEIPTKFIPGGKRFEPDLEKLQEKLQEIEKNVDELRDKEEKVPLKAEKQIKKEVKEAKKQKTRKEISEFFSEKKPEEKNTSEKQGFFSKLSSKIQKVKISEKEFEIYAEELEMLLLENNVAVEVAEKIIQKLKEEIIGKDLLKKELESEIKDVLKNIIEEILVEPFSIYEKVKQKKSQEKKPYVILFCGINGTGKTTTIAKVAHHLKNQNLSCVLAAADTFRAASIEQIKEHAEKLGIKVIAHEYEHDPASVGFDAIKYAQKNAIDCVLIDTAGRMHTSKNLLKEIEKISKVCEPDLKIFVGESITGNDAVEQIKSFDWSIGIDGIILTKADIDEKGGTALSVGYVSKKPILYLGTGQVYDNIEPFDKKKFIQRLGL